MHESLRHALALVESEHEAQAACLESQLLYLIRQVPGASLAFQRYAFAEGVARRHRERAYEEYIRHVACPARAS
jgi:hypothetical protein